MTGKSLNPHGLVDPTLLHPEGDWCERCQRSCGHDSSTGVDDVPSGPDKVWRCDICGWLHRVVQIEDQPEGNVVLRGLSPSEAWWHDGRGKSADRVTVDEPLEDGSDDA